uniref:Photosystem II Psb31 protein domain-containing protein n=1 Tax=Chaetoceros debilis TaxID=122233 RepID=A0A7S3V6H2_9STRA|mmetsp:Transcript_13261/g.19802  ORF Transcript_13261/g.19802 Transcript_13261/m.19802 type:complete len:282 (-) Transcript_13261:220-1065(-)|eukprot:CAMPEP_0194072328 /NCGR_PEP_ID=MMETSP0149-20130528/93_1 /TAXON_ID=122233 /ORGANISM="Chaetoceros debilis, Strain MM31A-1" /LENGTH=281 /DNA_ID=CAMNT_0038752195 /DNA_START=47 /DNA_END=892 /DNA_ORIENTATION=+
MKLSAVVLSSLAVSASAFAPSSSVRSSTQLKLSSKNDEPEISRRNMLASGIGMGLTFLVSSADIANAGLLDDFGSDPKSIQQKKVEEDIIPANPKKTESNLEPNLRSNYYYPTNKKRYLPRIKKCNDAIPTAATAIGEDDWETVDEFVNKIADDTVLPLKLYTSSLLGGGTNVKVTFTKDMSKAADDFEKAQKVLVKATKKKDKTASSKALEDLSEALQSYRVAGRLTGADAGGDIPSVDEIRRSACRVQGRTFEQKVKDRDARLNAAKATSQPAAAAVSE